VIAANDLLGDTPETVNQAPEASGWFVKIKLSDPAEIDQLMDRAGYETFLATL
jgi:glycine cleavage system H protein